MPAPSLMLDCIVHCARGGREANIEKVNTGQVIGARSARGERYQTVNADGAQAGHYTLLLTVAS